MFSWLWGCMVLSFKVAVGSICWAVIPVVIIGGIGLVVALIGR